MNLDPHLRAVLSQEADLQNAPGLDITRLIGGGKLRKRRRNRARVGIAAAAAVLIAGGSYGVTLIDSGPAADQGPAAGIPQTYRSSNGNYIQPGTYRMFVGVDYTDVPIYADLTFHDQFWEADDFPVTTQNEAQYGSVAVYHPTALATGTGCAGDRAPTNLNTNVGNTPRKLARQLAHLPRSTVVESPKQVQKFGAKAIHLQLRLPDACGAGIYRVADTALGGRGISYGPTPNKVIIDFWVLDEGGLPVVVDTWHDASASSRLVNTIDRLRDSITFVTGW